MRNILIIGAGRSATSLIRYLLDKSEVEELYITIGDISIQNAQKFTDGHPNARGVLLDVFNEPQRKKAVEKSDLVISMLPAHYHIEVAKDCIEFGKHLVTASYVSDQMQLLHPKAKAKGLVFINEIGLDPGIDHMSAMQIIDRICDKGGKILLFESFTGGLIAPESDNNLWNYKFTWNPRNVVLAGQGGASCFIRNGEYKYIPYNRLFGRLDKLSIDGYGDFVGYANRDSLSYRSTYGLENIPTIFRGTLRRPGYCKSWDVFIELGMTDDSYKMENTKDMTPRKFINSFLPYNADKTVEQKFKEFLGDDRLDLYHKFEWLGIFENEPIIDLEKASPAEVLQKILVDKLSLEEGDKDMLVMVHEFEYTLANKQYKIVSSMVNIGEDQVYTSMSNTVGLPAAICAKMILNNEITTIGVTLPVAKEIYTPILNELEEFDIRFKEEEIRL